MEFFRNTKYVRLKSHHNKYLIAGSDGSSVKQSRSSKTIQQSRWSVELVPENPNLIRLKSFYDKYLTTSDESLMLGWTGKKAVQTVSSDTNASLVQWEPIREASLYVKLRAPVSGKYLRANFGAPPWRNTVTVDVPEITATRDWIMWVVEVVLDDDIVIKNEVDRCVWMKNSKKLLPQGNSNNTRNRRRHHSYDSSCSTSSSSTIDPEDEVVEYSPWQADDQALTRSSVDSSSLTLFHGYKVSGSNIWRGMELFQNAKLVRLRSHHDKYLTADDDKEAVTQDRNGGSRRARWTVEYVKSVEGVGIVRLKSCYDKYLTATDDDFLLGAAGKKVKQTTPRRLDSSIEWEPMRDGMQVKLKTRYGNFLRANGGVPPWRNSITHDVPSRSHTQDWILWEVDVLEVYPKVEEVKEVVVDKEKEKEKGAFERCESEVEPFTLQTPTKSQSGESGVKNEGRVIHYNIVDDEGNIIDEGEGSRSLDFKGTGVQELTQSLEEETGLSCITLCTRSPLNNKLYPMRLALPPNHVQLHIYVVPSSSKAAAELA